MSQIRKSLISLFMFFVIAVVKTYTLITFPIYYMIQKPNKKLALSSAKRSRQLNPSDPYSPWTRIGESPCHVLTTCKTISEGFEMVKKLYQSDRPAIAYRKIIHEEVVTDENGKELRVDGKTLRKFRLSDYQWMTYGEVFQRSDYISKGMLINGFQRKERIVVLSETCADNLIFAISLASIGAVTVGVFANLGDDGIIYAINETNPKYIYTTYDLLPKVCNLLKRCPSLTTVIYVDSQIPLNNNNMCEFPNNIIFLSISKLISDGMQVREDLQGVPLDVEDIPLIGYTSGTTGAPKGVFATIAQGREAGIAILPAVEKFMTEAERHIYVAYLPQSHVLEASLELVAFLGGCRIGFATPFTLNESAPGLAEGEVCDLKLLKPTIMITVPLVLDRMRKEMYHKLAERTPVSTDLFNYLISYKINWTQKGYDCPIVNMLLCPKVREQFGGRLEHMIVGGAPLSPQLQALIKASLNVTLIQGFGATETLGAVLCMDDNDMSYGRCGAPLGGIQIKLIDWIEGGYKVTDKPNPRGELVVGSYSIASGYYNNPNLTEESFQLEENGMRWFFTGDIGEVFPDGTFKIIDRKKDLIKLANGEYISLGKIESALKHCIYVENICVIGDAFVNFLVALVMPNMKALNILRRNKKLPDLPLEQICANNEVIQTIHESIIESGFQNKLKRIEIPVKITVCHEEWSPDNGVLTAAMKLKRTIIMQRYKSDIERMLTQSIPVK